MAIVVGAIAAGILVVGSLIWLVGIASGDPQPPEEAAEPDAGRSATLVPSPSIVTSPSPVGDADRISAIIADAHSGKYFSNKFQDTYPKLMEVGLVKAMIEAANDDPMTDPMMTDAFFACSLPYVETHWSFRYMVTHPKSVGRGQVGVRIGFACIEYMNL